MDSLSSINNVSSVLLNSSRRNIPRKIEPLPINNVVNNNVNFYNKPPEPPILSQSILDKSLKDIIKEKDEHISSLSSTNMNIAHLLFDMNDKIMQSNKLLTDQSKIIADIKTKNETEGYNDLLEKNRKLKLELTNIKNDFKELKSSYKHLNSIYIHSITSQKEAPLSPTQYNKLKDEFSEFKEKLNCRICFENKINITLEPCGHTSLCLTCIRQLMHTQPHNTKCPLCNCIVTRYKRVYLPI